MWVANVIPSLPAIGAIAIVLVIARMLVGALQFVSGWLLLVHRTQATVLATAALALSAALVVLEFGLRLAPLDQDPAFRWFIVCGYGVYAAAWIAYLHTRPHRQ